MKNKYTVTGIQNNIASVKGAHFSGFVDGAEYLTVGETVELRESEVVMEGQLAEYQAMSDRYNGVTPVKFQETTTACGNVLRSNIVVEGREFRLELSMDRKTLQIIDEDARCATFDVSGRELWMSHGEDVISNWTDAQVNAVLNAI